MATRATTLKRAPRPVAQGDDGDWQVPPGGVATNSNGVPAPWTEPPPIPADDEQTETDRVIELMRGAGAINRASVKVYKMDGGTSAFCDNFLPAEFEDGDYSKIRDAFGPGKYKIIFYGEHPQTGTFGILAREHVTLMASARPRETVAPAQQNDALAQVLQTMVENQRQMNERLMALQSAPAPDPMAQMGVMLGLMTQMRTAMGLDSSPQRQSPLADTIAAIKELRGVAAEIIPERAEEPNLLGMLPQALDVMKTALAQPPQQTQVQQNPAPALPHVTVPAPIAQQPATPENDQVKLTQMIQLKTNLSKLVAMAKSTQPPEEGGKLVYEELPDEFVDILYDEKWLDMLALIDGEVRTYAEWFTNARNHAIALFDAAENETAEGSDLAQSPT